MASNNPLLSLQEDIKKTKVAQLLNKMGVLDKGEKLEIDQLIENGKYNNKIKALKTELDEKIFNRTITQEEEEVYEFCKMINFFNSSLRRSKMNILDTFIDIYTTEINKLSKDIPPRPRCIKSDEPTRLHRPIMSLSGAKKIPLVRKLEGTINEEECFQHLIDNVDEEYKQLVREYKIKHIKEITEDDWQYFRLSDFTGRVFDDFFKSTDGFINVLIIDYENYNVGSTLEQKKHHLDEMIDYIREHNINHIIIISKAFVSDFYIRKLKQIGCMVLTIQTDGLTLHDSPKLDALKDWRDISNKQNAQSPRFVRKGLISRTGFGASNDISRHISKGSDDFLMLYVFELCKKRGYNPIIYSSDANIKRDLLSPSNVVRNMYSYKHIPPFFCVINTYRYLINPFEITLEGNNYIFDDFYKEMNPDLNHDIYLQKYLKYKSKYMQLKKLI